MTRDTNSAPATHANRGSTIDTIAIPTGIPTGVAGMWQRSWGRGRALPRLRIVGGRAWSASADLDSLVAGALAKDQDAWRALVDRLKGVAWKVIYGYDMDEHDRKDVFASTFFRLHERLDTVREPQKLPGWIATTALHEVHAAFRKRRRFVPMDSLPLHAISDADHDEQLLDGELHQAVRAALRELPAKSQALMRLLSAEPPLSYDEISELLGIPRGSIGPMRRRCLERLRNSEPLAPFRNGGRQALP